MHRHLRPTRVAVASKLPRPAKVIVLETRRKARLQARQIEWQPTRPAA